jgi:predicted short-subunit dehydrogenase-like oxidoreductase (DUF2520 family)
VCAEINQSPCQQGFRQGAVAPLRFALAGPGRVGTSLALWLLAGGAELVAIAGRDPRAPLDPRLPPAPRRGLGELESAGADLLLLTVADPAIEAVARQLSARPQAAVVLHASGPLGAEALAPLGGGADKKGSAVGTLHPLRAFPQVQEKPEPGTFYGIGGDPAALALARRLAAAWGGRAVEVPAERRLVYHLAATLAAGGVTTVFASLAELLERAGLPRELLEANLHLMDGALAAVRRAAAARSGVASFDRAITGPAARGDLATLAVQRAALTALAPELEPVVAALQDEALRRGRRLREGADASHKAISSTGETPPVVNPERE